MATQITISEVIETIAQLNGWKPSEIKNLDMENETFEKGKGVFMFELTPKKTGVKAKSIKFLWTASDYQNCIN
jgi:hypothetical protein